MTAVGQLPLTTAQEYKVSWLAEATSIHELCPYSIMSTHLLTSSLAAPFIDPLPLLLHLCDIQEREETLVWVPEKREMVEELLGCVVLFLQLRHGRHALQ